MKPHQSPVTNHKSRRRSFHACPCRHCQFWRAKVAEVDAALGLVTGAHEKLKWAHDNSTKRLVENVDTMAALHKALREVLDYSDRMERWIGKGPKAPGWLPSDTERLAEIRGLVQPPASNIEHPQ